jgi:RNA polymerase sigma factor (sigma-70 family)
MNHGGVAESRGRATIEMIRRHEAALKRTARRYSLCAEDAEDAYQRALEIALTKAPTDRPDELIRWTQTVTKHEALAIRRNRERLLGNRPARERDGESDDWLALIPAAESGPGERVERREAIARSREALRTLKPAELRALTLLAEGYSYAEISSITGFSATKVNRCLAEGRERFRGFIARSAAGERCREMLPLVSSFCDGELGEAELEQVREHLRACAGCRAAMRSYRAAPGAAAALAPAVLPARSLLERLSDAIARLHSRMPGGSGGSSVAQATAMGGAPATGMTAIAKAIAVCAVTAGGAAACVAAGVTPPVLAPHEQKPARIERLAERLRPSISPAAAGSQQAGSRPEGGKPARPHEQQPERRPSDQAPSPPSQATPPPEATTAPSPEPAEAEAADYAPPPPVESTAPPSGSAAGEFGP